ncbi:MAG: bleomycin resistance family protein [Chitinophagaceae bacterium]|nr:MAG: bleomycin resistance family protein [Chitinophagaceae bacterium]
MRLSSLRPMPWVPDVRATIDWYVSELGFTEGNYVTEWQWGVVVCDAVTIMLAAPTAHTEYAGPAFTGSLYLNTNDVAAWWERLREKPYVFYPLEAFPWGMLEFAIRDCNGFMLQFGQEQSAE